MNKSACIPRTVLFAGTADSDEIGSLVAYKLELFQTDGTLIGNVSPGPLDENGFRHARVPGTGYLSAVDLTMVENGVYDLVLTVDGDGTATHGSVKVDSGWQRACIRRMRKL